ncbi:origin of replication complex subunit 5-like [Chenopodium quinoa]|uniref:origin of replication complex subunit 5-like n=1 Tax=Chenopodium quinoa TaxID=63459 RepID=UPI000B76EB83|nr:origin of replication complex subunit 5-like [Chenopodium quinoa]XP_021748524.1 origin of replication complex subunit 5-like [Chenopodium quinoa]
MGNEETPQSSRRTTRSLASADNCSEKPRKSISYKPTVYDFIYSSRNGDDKNLSLDDLISSFPGRNTQITEVLGHLGPLNSPMLPLFIYGGTSTGKTSIILEIFRYLKRPFVYSSCVSCYSPRILFESILNQLAFHKRSEQNGYLSVKKCDKPSDFANFVREALVSVLDILKGKSAKLSSKRRSIDDLGNMIYLIFDDFELVRAWDKSSTVLPFLFGLYRMLGLPEVGIIFLSKVSPDVYYTNSGHFEPVSLYFPGYTEKDLRQIFMLKREKPELNSCFLDIVLKPFSRVTRQVDELSVAFHPLYERYCEPLNDPGSNFSWETKQKREDAKRRLFSHLVPHIRPSLNEVFKISSLDVEAKTNVVKGKAGAKKLGAQDEELDFHMSVSAKYLLISAFLASRNPATLDASFFDSTGGQSNGRKKRKCSEKSTEQKEMAEQELLLKGPGTFPLERLLAIFQCITYGIDESVDEEVHDDDDGSLGNQGAQNDLTSSVLLQVSSLCNANFLSKGSSCPLEGSIRYKSTVSEELAVKIARSLKFPISRYLYRR